MRWEMLAVLIFGLFCADISAETKEEPHLKIMARSSVYNVGEKKGIYCEGTNVSESIYWYSPTGEQVEGRSTKNTRVYVERKIADHMVALIIHSTMVKDSGNWTCKAGDLSETIEIVVGVKVKMAVKNEKIEADEGKTTRLTCEAENDPTPVPVVQWYMDRVPLTEDSSKYVMKQKDNTFTLEIKRLTHADAGEYVCKVMQKLLSHYTDKTISLSVHHKPILFNTDTKEIYPIVGPSKFRTEEVYAVMNDTKNITCSALANPAPTFRWYRRRNNFDELIPEADTIVTSEDGMSSTMILRMHSEEDKGQYKCTASNPKGQVTVIFDVTPGNAPSPPNEIKAVSANGSYIVFNVSCWDCTFKTEETQLITPENLPVTGYSFQLVTHSPEGFLPDWEQAQEIPVDIINPEETLFAVGPLINSTEYHIRVRTRNDAGFSDWLEMELTAKTTDHAVRLAATMFLIIAAVFITRY